jgi:hypothetical protein
MMVLVRNVAIGLICISLALLSVPSSAESAEWTIMVFMNGKNNLEVDAIDNFYSMAAVDSTAQVNVVVELGRPEKHYTDSDDGWSGVRRFLIKKGSRPRVSDSLSNLQDEGKNTDMGRPEPLKDFLSWAMSKFPANHYMLIIWNHGQGWRFQLAQDREIRGIAASRAPVAATALATLKTSANSVPPLNGFRSVSLDEDTGNILYNNDIQQVLDSSFTIHKLDLLGFDACLMAMIETGFAFRNSVGLMVGSEELEPAEGWQYAAWLKALTDNPSIDASNLAKAIVESYRDRYGNTRLTTLSSLDLGLIDRLAVSVSALSSKMNSALTTERAAIQKSRSKITTYGQSASLKTSIDLEYFLDKYRSETNNPDIRSAIDATLKIISDLVLVNYASTRDLPMYGSRGIAIYFPGTRANFLADRDSGGYRKDNTSHPVEFVAKHRWSDFLLSYLQVK